MRKLYLSTILLITALVVALQSELFFPSQNGPALNNEQIKATQFLSSIINKFTPKMFLSKVSAATVLATQIDSTELPSVYSFNPERTYTANKKTDVTTFWKGFSGSEEEADAVRLKLAEAKIPVEIKGGTTANVSLDTDGTILSASWRLDEKTFVSVNRYLGNTFAVKKIADSQETQERIVTGTIFSSFVEAALNAGLPYSLVDDYVDLFGDRIDFRRDLQPGDTFAIILDQKRGSDGKWLSNGTIKAACLMNDGKLKAVVRYQNKGGQFVSFNERGEQMGSFFLKYPLQFTRISSVFTNARFHPVLGIRRPHNGVDFAAPVGTPVRSIADGVVIAAGYFGDSGKMVKIQHNGTYSTAYLHLSQISNSIRKGSKISRGQVIGAVGMTGLATGPHLHFSMYQNGKYIDPLKSKMPSIVNEKDLAAPQFIQASLSRLKDELRKSVMTQSARGFSGQG